MESFSSFINDELTAIDTEEAFEQSLDEEGPVEVCGIDFDRSTILKELDPTAYRTGMNDMFGSSDYVEFEGEYYNSSDFEDKKSDYESQIDDEIDTIDQEINEREEEMSNIEEADPDGEDEGNTARYEELETEIANLKESKEELEELKRDIP